MHRMVPMLFYIDAGELHEVGAFNGLNLLVLAPFNHLFLVFMQFSTAGTFICDLVVLPV